MSASTGSLMGISSKGNAWRSAAEPLSGASRLAVVRALTPIDHSPIRLGGNASTSISANRLWREIRTLNPIGARQAFEAAERSLISDDFDGAKNHRADLFAVQAMTLIVEDDTLNAAAAADQALRCGPSGSFARLAGLVQRYCAWKAGAAPPSCSDSTFSALQATGSPRSSSPKEVLADVLDLTLAAAIEFSQLQVRTAEHLARCALRRAEQTAMTCVLSAGVLSRILYEQGMVQEAEQLLRSRLPQLRRAGTLDCVAGAYRVLAAAAAHAGDAATAMATLDEASDLAERRNWPRLLAAMLAERVRLCDTDDERRAALWLDQLHNLAERHRPRTRCARSEIVRHFHIAQIHVFLKFRMGAPPRAALAQLCNDAWLAQDLLASTTANLARAQCLWVLGEQDKALGHLVEVLRSAQASGLQQHLFDAGQHLAPMIERLLQQDGIDQDLLAFTVCLADGFKPPSVDVPPRRRRTPSGNDRLTTRERDILKLIGEGQTNKVIARTQGVGPETVKSHVKNIFVKLGVERRAQAVSKAERLGML
jgi:ATP/maltotriose-dependent transcriptional regulator MalT